MSGRPRSSKLSPIRMTVARQRGLLAVRAAAQAALAGEEGEGDNSDLSFADIERGVKWIDAYLNVYGTRDAG